jgi:hypothetical protein
MITPEKYVQHLIEQNKCYSLDSGKVALYHSDVEKMAVYYNVSVDVDIKVADGKTRFAVVKATATRDGLKYASLGEVHPDNNGFEYFVSVAEKRAADRAILKSLNLHGDVYSDSEIDKRKEKPKTQPAKPKAKVKTLTEEVENKILSAKDKESFVKLLGKYTNYLEQLTKENPGYAQELLEKIQVKQQQLEDKNVNL